jgi:hypothetical protein
LKISKHKRLSNAWNGRRLIAVLLFGLFLSVQVVAQIESLHKALHTDAGKPNHQCAVTMLQHGQVDTADCAVAVVTLEPLPIVCATVESFFIPSVDYSLTPGRGPPALLS